MPLESLKETAAMAQQTIFEIFTAHDGRVQGFRHTEAKARQTCERINPVGNDGLLRKGAPFHDYLPAKREGFYVVDDRGYVATMRPYLTRAHAEAKAMVENMGSDTRTFAVVEHAL